MFRGSVPADLRSIVHEQTTGWDAQPVYIGCSGNFTLERVLISSGRFALHSNDVQLYSSALGWYFADGEVPVTLKESSREALGWLEPYLDGGVGTLAVIMLGTRFLDGVGKTNSYYQRMMKATREQFPRMHAKTVERLQASDLTLASYSAMDVREWLRDRVPADGAVATFPPFFAGDYEQQFASLDDHFDWPEPEYPTLDEAGKDALIEQIVDRPRWIMGLHVRREALEPHLRGIVQTTNRGVPIYVYSAGGATRVVRPNQPLELVHNPRLTQDDEIGERMTLSVLTAGQFSTLRSQYMNHNIKPGQPLLAVAVSVDGLVIGAFAYSPPKYSPTTAYLLSDFPVSPTSYKHLAKLVLHAAVSKEAQMLVQRALSRRITDVVTTAFSQNPSSMKYRGLFSLQSRKESEDPLYKWMLNYESKVGRWTLAEGLAEWKRRYGARA